MPKAVIQIFLQISPKKVDTVSLHVKLDEGKFIDINMTPINFALLMTGGPCYCNVEIKP